MYKYIIKGGRKLSGEINVSGSKNASLPILAATILNRGISKLYNVPDINDVKTTFEILKSLGAKIKKDKNKVLIDTRYINKKTIPDELMRKLRSSVIMAGAILGRFGEVRFSYPGGCDIGARPIDLHLKNFEKLGIKITENSRYIECSCDKIVSKKIQLDFPSVGATENLILASILGNHEVEISNVAREPEIIDLVNFLKRMGAKIYGEGSNTIRIIGVNRLKGASYNIMPDRIEAGTLLAACAITGGNIKLTSVNPEHLTPILDKFEEMGCLISKTKDTILMQSSGKLESVDIKTMPYPGFPTDLQPIFSALLVKAKGTSIITENIFENRFKFMQEAKRLGAKFSIEGNVLVINGGKKLHGANVECTDLRGGAALVLMALVSRGYTEIEKLDYLYRGYEDLDKKLNKLGALIKKEEGE